METMFLFPGMFKAHIADSKLKQPDDYNDFDKLKYPHFNLFMAAHLGRPIEVFNLEENANIIANIPEEKLANITFKDLDELGVMFGSGHYMA